MLQVQAWKLTEQQVQKQHLNYFMNIDMCFAGIGCFKGTVSLQVRDDVKPYQVWQRCLAYALQEPFKKEMEILHYYQYWHN